MSGIIVGPDGRYYRLPSNVASQSQEEQNRWLQNYLENNQQYQEQRYERDRQRDRAERRANLQNDTQGWNPLGDRTPGFFGGVYSGIVHDIPRVAALTRAALDPNPENAEENQARIDRINQAREDMGDWTQMEDWVGLIPGQPFGGDDESVLQNLGDFSLWFRETLGRTLPAMAAGVAAGFVAPQTAAGAAIATGVGALASYPYLLGDMLDRNFQETRDNAEGPDYNFWATAGLAVPAAAVEGLSFRLVPTRIIKNVVSRVAARNAARAANEALPAPMMESILLSTAKEFGIGAATGASEEVIQSWLERIAAPGVEALGPEAFREYAMAALGGALMEGPLGGGLHAGLRVGENVFSVAGGAKDSNAEQMWAEINQADKPLQFEETYVPADVNDIVNVLQDSKYKSFNTALNDVRGSFPDAQAARTYLGQTSNVVQGIIGAFTPEGVQELGFNSEAISSLSDEQAIKAAEVAMAAARVSANGYAGFNEDAVFNTGNEQLNEDRRFLNEYTADIVGPDGKKVRFPGFKKSTLFNMPARTTQQLANYLRFQSQADPRNLDQSVVNIKDAIDKTTKDFQNNLDQAQIDWMKLQEASRQKERQDLLSNENPYPGAIAAGIVPLDPSNVFEEMFYEPTEQEVTDYAAGMDNKKDSEIDQDLMDMGMAKKDLPQGRMNKLQEHLRRKKMQADAYKNVPQGNIDRIRKQANRVMTNAKDVGINPAELLNMPATERYQYVAKNVPEGKAKRLRDALEKLDYELKELQADNLVKMNAKLLDIEAAPPIEQPGSTNTLDRLTIDYKDIETVRIDPAVANNTAALETILNKALPGKILEGARATIMNAVNTFGKSAVSRSQITSLVYGLNNIANLDPKEGHALFFTMRDLGVITEQEYNAMRGALPKYYDSIVAKETDEAIKESLREGFNHVDEGIMLSGIFSEGLANNNKFFPGVIHTNLTKALNRMRGLNNSKFRDILGSSWNSPQVRNFMLESGHNAWHNAQLEARSSAFVVPENLRAQIDAVNNPRNFSLEKGSLNYNTWQWQVNNQKWWKSMQKLTRQDPTLAKLVEFVEHFKDIQENYSHHLLRQYQRLVPDNDPPTVERTKRSLARLSLMRRTGQRLDRRTPDGRLIYKAKDPENPTKTRDFVVSQEETAWIDEVSSALKSIPMFFKHMMLDNIEARDIQWQGRTLGQTGTTVKDIEDYIKLKRNSLKEVTEQADKAILERELDELEGAMEILRFAEELLDPATPFFPQQRSKPNSMFRTYNVLNAQGEKIKNPAGTGPEKYLKIVLEVEKDPKTNNPLRASELEADVKAQRELEEYYIPHFGELGVTKLSDGMSTRRTHKQHIDINNGFEAFIGDLTALLRENKFNAEAANELVEKMRESQQRRTGEDILGGAIKNYMIRSSNIGGYNENFLEVLGNYFSIAPYMLATVQFTPLMNRVKAVLANETKDIPKDVVHEQMDDKQRQWYKRQWEYMTDRVNDWQALRAFNFTYALGFNYSTAFLNLFSVPTIVGPSIMLFGQNPVQASATMVKASRAANKMLQDNYLRVQQAGATIKGRTVEMLYSPATNKQALTKIYKTPGKTRTMQVGLEFGQNHLQQTLMEDVTGTRVATPVEGEATTLLQKANKFKDQALLFAGGPIHMAERFTRLSAYLAYLDAMTNADGTVNVAAVESYLAANKTNNRIQQALNLRKLTDLSDPQTVYRIAIQLVKETHGVYDKTGRGPIQRGWAGALLFPFMTYPITVLEFLGNMALHSGPQGKAVFAASMMMFFTFAGIAGIPGSDSWKELLELWVQAGFGGVPRSIDADERIHYVLTQKLGLPESIARMLETGVLGHPSINMDMGRRIGVPMPWENALYAIANPGDSYAISKITGVGGRMFIDLSRGRGSAVLPVMAQNILRATSWPSQGIMTSNGVPYKRPEDVTLQEVFLRFIGIQPMSVTSASRDSRRMRTLSNMYMQPHINRVRRDYERDAWELFQARQANDRERADEIQRRMQRRLYNLRMEAYERGEFVTPSQIRGIETSAANYVNSRARPYEYAREQQGRNAQESFRYNSTLFNTWMENRDE